MTVTGATKVLAVLGDPVAHSLSPAMLGGWIADHGLDAVYVPLRVDRGEAARTFQALPGLGLHGANVTVPFKETALEAASVHSADVKTLGVANTLAWIGGQVHAFNTDCGGARAAIEEAHPGWAEAAQRVLVIGAGGAARAMAFGLVRGQGPHVTFVNRTRGKAEEAAALMRGFGPTDAQDWSALPDAFAEADVIVNASTLGMTGHATHPWPIERAKPSAIVYDAVYAPLETDLLKAARLRGLRTVDGLGMLIHQGAMAFRIWFGVAPDTAKARARLLAILAARA
ncbi:MAG: shikimate dehydrogenase [Hyphomonadaceae bacterium]|nr:shikimate dehydrogenase [Hyphomonadaceae bacterium]